MPALTPLKLDDRRYQEIRDELIRRIPVHSPQWTDHNISDPGVVLLELFAFLGGDLLYQINRVPEKAQREFLNLLNLPLKPYQVARALVKFDLPKDKTEPLNIPFGGVDGRTRVAAAGVTSIFRLPTS